LLLYLPAFLLLSVATFVFFHDELARSLTSAAARLLAKLGAGFYKAAFIQFARRTVG